MGFWKDLKKEWTWKNIKGNWPDLVSVIIAACVAYQYHTSFWKYFLVWLIAFFFARFVILTIKKISSK